MEVSSVQLAGCLGQRIKKCFHGTLPQSANSKRQQNSLQQAITNGYVSQCGPTTVNVSVVPISTTRSVIRLKLFVHIRLLI